MNCEELLAEFNRRLDVDWRPPEDLLNAAEEAIRGCADTPPLGQRIRFERLLALINSKLGVNEQRFQEFLNGAAEQRILLNYHEKAEVLTCFDTSDEKRFRAWAIARGVDAQVTEFFLPVSPEETIAALHEQLRTGHVIRKDARKCDVSERRNEILRGLFGSFVFQAFPIEAMHRHFNKDCRVQYLPSFYDHLGRFQGDLLKREYGLIALTVDEALVKQFSEPSLRDALYGFVENAFQRLSNHCYFAVLIKHVGNDGESKAWRLFSDLVLYAEKHREILLGTGYFKPEQVKQATCTHVPDLDTGAAKFELANEGFLFRDCFVLIPGEKASVSTSMDEVHLLLTFAKDERDERIVPCPACRSVNVRGNSYPSLGVKSWECQNPICPERSAFDRGKRYSLAALIKQRAINSEEDQIPEEIVRRWKLDVVAGIQDKDVLEMLVRHFTLHGDKVLLVNWPKRGGDAFGRKLFHEQFPKAVPKLGAYEAFQDSSLFKRFMVERKVTAAPECCNVDSGIRGLRVVCGDCFDVLRQEREGSLDGAVTSPPYYNAKEYSRWPNIYCYLYDMYNAARSVYRVLKPGGLYLFNIFDYFDNENTIVFSTMGKKRMILGAYIINIFRRIGFEVRGNVVWYKGEIEGKRNFNQGNFSPYYQLPFNCWEHVLVFQKPGGCRLQGKMPTVLVAQPVIKIVKGENVLGHSAPFPTEIPDLLLEHMKKGEWVLDPYAGSMTTARAALARGINCLSVEMHMKFCRLGVDLLKRRPVEQCLFT